MDLETSGMLAPVLVSLHRGFSFTFTASSLMEGDIWSHHSGQSPLHSPISSHSFIEVLDHSSGTSTLKNCNTVVLIAHAYTNIIHVFIHTAHMNSHDGDIHRVLF